MKTKTLIILGAVAAAGAVLVSQRKKIAALMAQDKEAQSDAATKAIDAAKAAASMMPFGADPVPLVNTAQTTQQVAAIVNTSVTTLAGIAGLALTAMTLTEKKRALAKS